MTYLYSIPLKVTGPSITYHCVHPVDWMTVLRISRLSEDEFAKLSILSTNCDFNRQFNTLAQFKYIVQELSANRSVSWTTQTHLYVLCGVSAETAKYLKNKGCARSRISFKKQATKYVFNFNFYQKGNDTALYLGNAVDMELTSENINNLAIPSCTFEHCLREYLFTLKQDPVNSIKTFTEDGQRFEVSVEKKTIKDYLYL